MSNVVAPFEKRTGHRVDFTTTRDLKAALEAGIEAGDPPDIAGLPGPGYMTELARAGELVDLGTVIDLGAYKRHTAPAFVHLGTVDSKLVGVFLKGTVKGLLWFNPDVYRKGPFAAWTRLQHAAKSVGGGAALVRRARVGRVLGLAGHRLDRGLRPAPERPAGLRRVGGRAASVGRRRRSAGPSSRTARSSTSRTSLAASRARSRHALQPRRGRPLHRSAGVPLRPPGHVHVDLPR